MFAQVSITNIQKPKQLSQKPEKTPQEFYLTRFSNFSTHFQHPNINTPIRDASKKLYLDNFSLFPPTLTKTNTKQSFQKF